MPTILDSLFVRLGFQVETKGLGEFEHKVSGLHHAMEAMGILAGVELVKRVGEFVERAVEGAAGIQKLSEATNMAATEIDTLDRVAASGGVSMQSMHETIMSVVRATGAAAAGFPRYTKLFAQLGFSHEWIKQQHSAGDIMVALADKFKHMTTGMRLAVAGRLGIDPRMAAMMSEGGAAFKEKLAAEGGQGLLSNEDYKAAHETEITFTRLHRIIGQVVTLVAIQLAPALRKVADAFEGWWKANKEELLTKFKNGVARTGELLAVLWHMLTEAWGAASRMYAWFDKLGVSSAVFKGVIGGLVAFKLGAWLMQAAAGLVAVADGFKAANLSTGLLGLMAIALVLAIDEIWTALQGGDSYLSDFQQKWSGAFNTAITLTGILAAAFSTLLVNAVLKAAGVIGLTFAGTMAWMLPLLIGVAGLAYAANDIIENWEPVKQWFGELWDEIVEGVKTALEWLLKIPGAKTYFRAVTGLDTQKWADEREGKHNFERTLSESAAPNRFYVNAQGQMVGTPNDNRSTASVKIDTVNISADKGREGNVGNDLGGHMKTAVDRVRASQHPVLQ